MMGAGRALLWGSKHPTALQSLAETHPSGGLAGWRALQPLPLPPRVAGQVQGYCEQRSVRPLRSAACFVLVHLGER
jgi:hypothetical protein